MENSPSVKKRHRDTAQVRADDKRDRPPLSIDKGIEDSVEITVGDLTSLYLLMSVKGFGPQKFKELWKADISVNDVVNGRAQLPMQGKRGDSLRKGLEQHIESSRSLCQQRATNQILAAHNNKAKILTYAHPSYPPNVLDSNYPIPVIYAIGSPAVLRNHNSVACVGSRKTRAPYDRLHEEFATMACSSGFSITSGFALGADTIGHKAAVAFGGQTICVMPNGLDRPFPPENKDLWQHLLSYGNAVLVSEYPFGTRASALTLRKRNKLIVAFARGVLVSQSSVTGGAMNAYRFALEQRKPIATFRSDEQPDTSGNHMIQTHEKGPHTVFASVGQDQETAQLWLQQLSYSI